MSTQHHHLVRWIGIVAAAALMACSGNPKKEVNTTPKEGVETSETGTKAEETAQADEKTEPAEPKKAEEPAGEVVKAKKVLLKEQNDATKEAVEEALGEILEGGSVDTGIEALKDVLDDDPDAYLAAHNLAILYDQQGNQAEARRYYEKALDIEPDFSPSLVNLVRLELRTGSVGEARRIADTYIAKRPDTVEHRLARLEVLLAEEKTDALIEESRSILKRDEANPRARYYMAAAHYRAGRFPLAEFIVTQALDIDPMDAELHFLNGLVMLALDEEIKARDAFSEAIRLRPDYPEAQNAVGLMRYRSRDFERAEASFRVALKYAPDFKEAWLNLGNALKAQDGRGAEAEAAYLKALEVDPQWPDARFSLGALYLAYEVIPLSSFANKPKERLTRAKEELEHAKSLWNEPTEQELAQRFIAKADKSLEIVIAEEELRMLEESGGGGGDPFGEGGGGGGEDPFGDGGGGSEDPFGDGGGGGGEDPFEDDGGGGGEDPFEEDGGGGGGEDPFEDGGGEDPFE